MKIKVFALLCITLFVLSCFIGCGDSVGGGGSSDIGGSEDVISSKVNKIENIADYVIVRS